jgi:RNA polymerase sigma-70 factor (ECF subfamily)
VAHGILGSVGEADDAVQQAWLRLRRSDADAIIDRPGPGAAAHTGRR